MAVESKRGCGYRKVGGLYVVASGMGMPCCKMPLLLSVCPCCGAGVKQGRGWQWIDAGKMFANSGDCVGALARGEVLGACPLQNPAALGRVGLLWIGEKFYPRPADFMAEGKAQGISRRIKALPRDWKPGMTVMLAHPKTIRKARTVRPESGVVADVNVWVIIDPRTSEIEEDVGSFAKYQDAVDVAAQMDLQSPIYLPGVFYVFRPERFELIVKQSEYGQALADIALYDASGDENRAKSALHVKYENDHKRGITWVPVPDDDKDHQGTAYDKEEEPA